MALELDGPLWKFALDFYRQPGVSQACLTLQDEAGVDVVHLICILYASVVLGCPMSKAEISGLLSSTAEWREAAILPLRRIRRELKAARPGFPAQEQEVLRNQVKQTELLAEQIQLAMVNRWLHENNPVGVGLDLKEALETTLEFPAGQKPDAVRQALDFIVEKVALR